MEYEIIALKWIISYWKWSIPGHQKVVSKTSLQGQKAWLEKALTGENLPKLLHVCSHGVDIVQKMSCHYDMQVPSCHHPDEEFPMTPYCLPYRIQMYSLDDSQGHSWSSFYLTFCLHGVIYLLISGLTFAITPGYQAVLTICVFANIAFPMRRKYFSYLTYKWNSIKSWFQHGLFCKAFANAGMQNYLFLLPYSLCTHSSVILLSYFLGQSLCVCLLIRL